MMQAIIDTRIKKAVTFHIILHGFRAGRVTGTDVIKLKLARELESLDNETLFLVFLDLMKAYDNLNSVRILKTLEGYREGPKMRSILEEL